MLLPHKKNILLLQSTQCGFCNNAYLIEELALAILHLFKLVIISLQNTFTIQNEVEYKLSDIYNMKKYRILLTFLSFILDFIIDT